MQEPQLTSNLVSHSRMSIFGAEPNASGEEGKHSPNRCDFDCNDADKPEHVNSDIEDISESGKRISNEDGRMLDKFDDAGKRNSLKCFASLTQMLQRIASELDLDYGQFADDALFFDPEYYYDQGEAIEDTFQQKLEARVEKRTIASDSLLVRMHRVRAARANDDQDAACQAHAMVIYAKDMKCLAQDVSALAEQIHLGMKRKAEVLHDTAVYSSEIAETSRIELESVITNRGLQHRLDRLIACKEKKAGQAHATTESADKACSESTRMVVRLVQKARQYRCGRCGGGGHNVRTCPEALKRSSACLPNVRLPPATPAPSSLSANPVEKSMQDVGTPTTHKATEAPQGLSAAPRQASVAHPSGPVGFHPTASSPSNFPGVSHSLNGNISSALPPSKYLRFFCTPIAHANKLMIRNVLRSGPTSTPTASGEGRKAPAWEPPPNAVRRRKRKATEVADSGIPQLLKRMPRGIALP
jgi:hypothetical protein